MSKELCFVLMPFGKKPDANGTVIDFNAVYERMIKPAIEKAGLEPLRADEEEGGGIIHTPMFERLILCPYAIADMTTANANVFYELGVRHAQRPSTTILLYGGVSRLPFDVQPLRALHYAIDATGLPEDPGGVAATITKRLQTAREDSTLLDSPLYQLLEDYPKIQHEKTDVFRRQVNLSNERKGTLATARRAKDRTTMVAVERDLEPVRNADAGVVTDLLLSYRDIKAWDAMVSLVVRMSRPLAETVLVQEQFALALNRLSAGKLAAGAKAEGLELSARAESAMLTLLGRRGASSETYGILGRVYKDRWRAAVDAGDEFTATGHLEQAIDAYRRGFEADWRDAFPGINAVTLMTIHGEYGEERDRLLPVVRYAVERRTAGSGADYWDWATLVELAVIGGDETAAKKALRRALPLASAGWMAETTARQIGDLRAAQGARGQVAAWSAKVQEELTRKAA